MKKKAARALAGVLTLSMAAALTACGGSGDSETPAAVLIPQKKEERQQRQQKVQALSQDRLFLLCFLRSRESRMLLETF